MPIFHEFPYGNMHDQNYDWILKVVKEMLEKYQDIDAHVAEALAQIEAAKTDSLADVQTALENALSEINIAVANFETIEAGILQNINDAKDSALADIDTDKQAAHDAIVADRNTAVTSIGTSATNAITAIDANKRTAIEDIQSHQESALLAVQAVLNSALMTINSEGNEAIENIRHLYDTLPADSQAIIGQLHIIMAMLNNNYTTTYPWGQWYYTGTSGINRNLDNTYLSADETQTSGCSNCRMIFSTAQGYHLYELSWWNYDPNDTDTVIRNAITFPANTTYYDYTFPANAVFYSITVRKDDLSVITSQDVAGNITIQILANALNVPSMIAFEEADLTADMAHTVGTPSEYFLYNGALYRVLEDIPQYGTIVLSGTGKNCEETTVCEEISNNSEAINNNSEEISSLKSASGVSDSVINDAASNGGIFIDLYNDLEIGSINNATGVNIDTSVTRIRTKSYHKTYADVIHIELKSNYLVSCVIEYDSEKVFVKSTSTITASRDLTLDPRTNYIRIVFYQNPQQTYTEIPYGFGASVTFPNLNGLENTLNNIPTLENMETTENLFNYGIRIGLSVSFAENAKYAISQPFDIYGKSISVRATKLPDKVKYLIAYWNGTAYSAWGNSYVSDDSTAFNANASSRTKAMAVFAKTDGSDITASDIVGLELIVINGLTSNIQHYIPNKNEVDYYQASLPAKIKSCTYNVGHYTGGVSGTITDQVITNTKAILCKINADILGLEENKISFNDTNDDDVFYKPLYPQIYSLSYTGALGLGMMAKYQLICEETATFSTGRNYMHCVIAIGRRRIDWFGFHLSPASANRTQELSEIISIISNKKYVVCTGDFNTGNDTQGSIDELTTFTNAGFKVANCGYLGRMNTHLDPVYGDKALDNIIVSNNIYISNAYVVEVASETNPSDHLPFVAELLIV